MTCGFQQKIINVRITMGKSSNKYPEKDYETRKRKEKTMYAIVETGGKQYPVEEGRYVEVELLDAEKDSKVVFDKIVMLVNGKKSKVGQPYVAGASVEGTVLANDKSKKVIVFKQRPKKGYRKKQGHRQGFTRVMINKIRTSAQKKAETTENAEA